MATKISQQLSSEYKPSNDLMYGYICFQFIDFMVRDKSLRNFNNFPYNFNNKKRQNNSELFFWRKI